MAAALCLPTVAALGGNPSFVLQEIVTGLEMPTAIAFRPDGAMLIAEFGGRVRVWRDGELAPAPFIDLSDEVGSVWNRGLLGIAVDPNFQVNGYVYLLYTVDEIFGPPEGSSSDGTFARLTRYTADPADGRNTALDASRFVLLGAESDCGFVSCSQSHTIGTLRFGLDGTLFVSAGDGASFSVVDDGGQHSSCFLPDPFPGFGSDEDIGAFRAQWLGSMSGKILRIDPSTGEGLSDNPFFTGDTGDIRSKVWVSGLRNPFRINVRPGTPPPGTLYIGDVGWNRFEEINVARGGENFGWPCFEGNAPQARYSDEATPAHSGCGTIGAPQNPGPETGPLVWWSHDDPLESSPSGFTGFCSVGGAFYEKANYPAEFRGAFFFADCIAGWVRAISTDADDGLVQMMDVITSAETPVAIETDPATGDLYIVEYGGSIRRLSYPDLSRTDLDEDGDTDMRDMAIWMLCFSDAADPLCLGCPRADVNADKVLDLLDWKILEKNTSGPY